MDHTTTGIEGHLTQLLRQVDLHIPRRQIDFPTGLAETIRRAHREVDLMIDQLGDNDADAAALTRQVAEIERLKRRVESVQLRLAARAGQLRAHEDHGQLDQGTWLATTTGSDPRQAAGHAALADALGDTPGTGEDESSPQGTDQQPGATEDQTPEGDPTPSDAGSAGEDRPEGQRRADGRPCLTATGTALDAGTISSAHAQVIMRALDDLPETVTDEQRRTCELELLRLATNRSPSQLRRASRRVLEAIEPREEVVDQHEDDLVADEEERARDAASFWIKDNRDGTVTGHFTVPWVSGMILKKVIDAMTAPRRQTDNTATSDDQAVAGADDAGFGAGAGSTSKDRYLGWQHRRGLAFADLLMRIPTDHLHTKVAATMLITTRLSDLTDNLEGAGTRVATTDLDDVISAGTARRLACGAGLLPAVLDGDSVPLDLGRQRRFFTDNQRAALAGRYDTCAAEDCDRPFAWTEIHHLTPWKAGGRTDLHNSAPLCGQHHHMIDSPHYTHTIRRLDRQRVSITFTRRT